MSDIFTDIDISKIDRINLQRQEPGKRGPGVLVQSGLPPYIDRDEIIGLCEELGPGRYKAVPLDARGKAAGPCWSWEIAGEPKEDMAAERPRRLLSDADEELRELRARHREELDELRSDMLDRANDTLQREIDQCERRANAKIELALLDAERRIKDAERSIEDARRRAKDDVESARDEVARLQMRMERMEHELATKTAEIMEAKERANMAERDQLEQRVRLGERITELESELKSQVRVHEAELRELRNGSPKLHAAIATRTTDWEIEKSKIMLQAELDREARENGIGAKLAAYMQQESVQEAVFPILNYLITSIMEKQAEAKPTAKQPPIQVTQPSQGAE